MEVEKFNKIYVGIMMIWKRSPFYQPNPIPPQE